MKGKRLGSSAWRTVMAGFLLVMAATACGGAQATPTAEPAMPTAKPVAPTAEAATPAVEPEPAKITVTFEGDQCVYHGPERLPAGRIPIVLNVRDQTAYKDYGVGAVTVDEGKTLEDLVAAPFATHEPVWVHTHALVGAPPGDSQETTIILFEGPLFLICAAEEKTNVLGPIEIEPVGTVADEITVTFDGERCIYNGPDEIPAGRITVVLDVEDQAEYEEYGLAGVTLDEGKAFEDLDAWPSTNPPLWVNIYGLLEEVPQGSRAEMPVIATERPLYLVCFTAYPITKSGVLGPVKVVE